jgi:hypothetical protein
MLAGGAQQRQQHALAGVAVARVLRPGVVDEQVAGACAPAPPCPAPRRPPAARHGPGRALHRRATAAAPAAAPARSRQGSGITSSAPPARPRPAPRPARHRHVPHGQRQRGQPPGPQALQQPAASAHSGGSSVPSRASGVTSSVISGIATRLATKPTSDICWKKTSVSGARPTVATACERRPPRMAWMQAPMHRRTGRESRAVRMHRLRGHQQPTATNDSQKPGCSSAHGSITATTAAAASSTSGQGQRARHCAAAPPRRASTPCAAPARPSRRAPHTRQGGRQAAPARGQWRGQPQHRARRAGATAPPPSPASQANMVTCRPLMLIRCDMPGAAEQVPVLALDGALVADGQRGQHSGRTAIGHALDGVAQCWRSRSTG